MTTQPKTIAFLGASTGVGLSALKHALAAGHQCIALCRTPSKLTTLLPPSTHPNLRVVSGNAHDLAAVSNCLRTPYGTLVDAIISTIGGKLLLSKMTLDDPQVCGNGMKTILAALAQLRAEGCAGRPRIVVCSTTGMSRFGRDTPLAIVPLYKVLLRVPHKDKLVMEDMLAESGEDFTIVRATWLTDGESERRIRVGVEDPKRGREVEVIGYSISREDAGRWVTENLVNREGAKYLKKIATITY